MIWAPYLLQHQPNKAFALYREIHLSKSRKPLYIHRDLGRIFRFGRLSQGGGALRIAVANDMMGRFTQTGEVYQPWARKRSCKEFALSTALIRESH